MGTECDFDTNYLIACSRFDNLRDQIQEKEDDSTKYKYDNTTSQECNNLIESMESSRAIRLVLISALHTSMVCTSLAVLAVMRIFCLLPDYCYWVCRIALYLSTILSLFCSQHRLSRPFEVPLHLRLFRFLKKPSAPLPLKYCKNCYKNRL